MTLRLLDQKLQKVMSMNSDSPDVLESLDSLATFYRPSETSSDSRTNLREILEKESLTSIEEFLNNFSGVAETFRTMEVSVKTLKSNCEELQDKINSTQEQTSTFLHDISQLREKQKDLEIQEADVMSFLKEYQLSSSEIAALERTVDVGASKEFYEALQRVIDIRARAQELLGTEQQSAGLEVMEEMAELQEAGLSRLYKWFQHACEQFGAEEVEEEGKEDPKEKLGWFRKALGFLKKRPLLYRHSQDFVADSRGGRLTRRFLTTVSVGDPTLGVRPIDMNAHDPVRYVGDVLAWVHQSALTETDTLVGMFGEESRNASSPNSEAAKTTEEDAHAPLSVNTLLDQVFADVMKPVMTRLQQVINAEGRIPVVFKILDMLMFYEETFQRLENAPRCLLSSMTEALGLARAQLEHLCKEFAQRLHQFPMVFTADLSPPPIVRDMTSITEELVGMSNASLAAPQAIAEMFNELLSWCWDPLLEGCRAATEGLSPPDAAVFVLNAMDSVMVALSPFKAHCPWKHEVAREVRNWETLLAKELAEDVLIKTGMAQCVRAVASHDGTVPLGSVAGLDESSLKTTAKYFYAAVFNSFFPSLARMLSATRREAIRKEAAESLVAAYQTLYQAVHDPANGFEEPSSIFPHTPLHVRTMLDIDEDNLEDQQTIRLNAHGLSNKHRP